MSRIRPALVLAAAAVVVAAALILTVGRDATARGAGATGPGAVSVGFAQDMIAHHEQALLMANLALTRGGPAVASIADGILIDQAEEIGQMEGWLQIWHEPIADPHPMSWMGGMTTGREMSSSAPSGQTLMPGMATASELNRLYTLRGRRFDVLFLELMIRHHEGGIVMAHAAELTARLGYVRRAATGMRIEQVLDIGEMEPILRADGGAPLPAPAGY